MDKAQDCTAHFTRMVEEYKQGTADTRARPTQDEDVPSAAEQKEIIIEKLKEQRESLEKFN